jgi:DNA-binding IclR family transcriptional regulator
MSAIDEILWLLKDGEWHNLKEITKKIALPKSKAEMVINFLGEYNFIQLNGNIKRVKLQPSILEFIEEIQHLEKRDFNSLGF